MSHILHQVSGGVLLGRDGENMCTCTLVDKYPKVEWGNSLIDFKLHSQHEIQCNNQANIYSNNFFVK